MSYEDFLKMIGSSEIDEIEKREKRKPVPKSTQTLRYNQAKGKCMRCGLNFAEEDLTPDYHHIDGNSSNSNPNNIEVLCPNCHRKETIKQIRRKIGETKSNQTEKQRGNIYNQNDTDFIRDLF